ncbi:MAG: hypothetical protein IKR23_06185 [Lachnospiraceae bacterium]|nr:hypothetical protein [Lachnospiraceae bacterium]
MPFLLFVIAVIAIGVLTIKLKRKNRKNREEAWKELGNRMMQQTPPQTAVQPRQQTVQTPSVDSQTEEMLIPQTAQDLATLVIPDSLPFAEEIRILKYMCEKYPDVVQMDLYDPASEITISLFEQRLGVRLPDEVRALYSFANGMDLCGMTISFDSLHIIEGLYRRGYDHFRQEGDQNDFIMMGTVMSDGSSLLLEKQTGYLLRFNEGEFNNFRDVTTLLKWLIGFEFDGYICNDDPVIKGYLRRV